MPYEVRPEEKAIWEKETWSIKTKENGEYIRKDVPIKELPVSHVKNILKYIKRRYNKMYYETYIENSRLWTTINLVAGTNPLDEYYKNNPKLPNSNTSVPNQAVASSPVPDNMPTRAPEEQISHKQDFYLLSNLINEEVAAIDKGSVTLDEVRDFLAGVNIKINTLASQIN